MPCQTPPYIQFDAFGGIPGERSLRFGGYQGCYTASTLSEVTPLLDTLQSLCDRGLIVVGFLSYEAACGINSHLPEGAVLDAFPYAWFAVYSDVVENDAEDDSISNEILQFSESDLSYCAYSHAVQAIRSFIQAGDSYQINYTMPLIIPFHGDPKGLYQAVCQGQESSYCAYIDMGRYVIVSASPELFFRTDQDVITTRPMKGTRARGCEANDDTLQAAALAASEKDRAENLMIVDLLRNDLAKIAQPGSVSVTSLFDIEKYPTVWQMTSTIRAQLKTGVGLKETLHALFPCGSVTGAPKKRSMEIIRMLETAPRGVYCGAIGYAESGRNCFSVPIRTVVIDREGGFATLCVGSGITADSDELLEYRECLSKARFATAAPRIKHALIETFRVENGAVWHLDEHMSRLNASAIYFGYPLEMGALKCQILARVSKVVTAHRGRLVVAPDGTWDLSLTPFVPENRDLVVSFAALRVASDDPYRYHKTTNRQIFDQAREACTECDEVLFLNERGELTEGSYHSVVLKRAGALVTPALHCGVLPGVFRQTLLQAGEVTEQCLYKDDVLDAEEIWLVNSLRGWRRAQIKSEDR